MNTPPDGSRLITNGGAIELRIPMTGLPHGHAVAFGDVAHTERPLKLFSSQPCCRRINFGLGRRHRIGVDLSIRDGSVDRLPNPTQIGGSWNGPQPLDVIGAEILQGKVQHFRTRTCFYLFRCRAAPSLRRPRTQLP